MRLRIALAAAAVSLALPAAASADTFCVNKSPCIFGTAESTVQSALVAAEQHPGPDVVRIGASAEPYEGPFSYEGFTYNPVEIIGDGPGQTVLWAGYDHTLSLGEGSKVSDLTVYPGLSVGGPTEGSGLKLDGADAENVTVVHPPASGPATGVVTTHDADLRNVTLDIAGGTGLSVQDGPQGTTVRDSTISAGTGVEAYGDATATLRNVRLSTTGGGAVAFAGGGLRLSNVLVTTSAPDGAGLVALAFAGVDAGSITANHVTVGRTAPGPDATGVRVRGGSVSLQNTIVHGYPVPILRQNGPSLSSSDLSVRYTNFDQAASLLGEGIVPGTVSLGPGNRNEDPHFAGPGDFHLRGDSSLIDDGEVTSLSAETDIDGLDRDTDGDGDNVGEVDLGAYEYQRRAPTAVIASPGAGVFPAGAPVGFSAAGSHDPDAGDTLAYTWSFGDGASGTGASAAHTYGAGGQRTATLTVTDPAGLTSTATTALLIEALATSSGPDPGQGPGPGGNPEDRLAPVLSAASLSAPVFRVDRRAVAARRAPRGTRIRFTLSEAASVRYAIARRSPGRRVGGTCRKADRRTRARPSCVRWVAAGAFARPASAGANAVRFAGRVRVRGRTRLLAPGRYRLTLVATDAFGNSSAGKRLPFRVAR